MSTLPVKQYAPLMKFHTQEISDLEWRAHEKTIRQMYTDKLTKTQMLDILAQKHAFQPSRGQLNARMDAWGLKVPKNAAAWPSISLASTTSDKDPSGIHNCPSDKSDAGTWGSNTTLGDSSLRYGSKSSASRDDRCRPVIAQTNGASKASNTIDLESPYLRSSRLLDVACGLKHAVHSPLVIQQHSPTSSPYRYAYPHQIVYITPARSQRKPSENMQSFRNVGYRTRTDSNVTSSTDRSEHSYLSMSACTRSMHDSATVIKMPDKRQSEEMSIYTPLSHSTKPLKQPLDQFPRANPIEAPGLIADCHNMVIEIRTSSGKSRSGKFFGDTLRLPQQRATRQDESLDGCRRGCACTDSSKPNTGEVEQLKGYHQSIHGRLAG